jgi:hypothetical protein
LVDAFHNWGDLIIIAQKVEPGGGYYNSKGEYQKSTWNFGNHVQVIGSNDSESTQGNYGRNLYEFPVGSEDDIIEPPRQIGCPILCVIQSDR